MERTRVLVVDDSADIRSSLKRLLELLGYEAETARDGAAALAMQETQGFGVLITDIFMPGTEGMETIARFKAGWPAMRVIAMSGGGERAKCDYLRAAVQIGADAAMQKPFSLETLVAALVR
jgi:two-component system, chemotaxis family, chemotaxis protein CheY